MLRAAFLPLVLLATVAPCQQPSVFHGGPNMRLASGTITSAGNGLSVVLVMDNDNGNGSLPTSWRRWWHCELRALPAQGTTLKVEVRNAGYSDVILPVWSRSADGGVTFGPWQRCPASAVPTVVGSTHKFTFSTGAGETHVRLAKYFPYLVADKNAFLASIQGHPHVRSIQSLGVSVQGRPIERVELTDGTVPDAGKRRVWIHAAVHPAETTSYFTVEGLVSFLLSGDPLAEILLDHAILDLVPMPNPDGVTLGNYRTNANSVEIESQWAKPYNSTQPEVQALRGAIEQIMGTSQAPGSNPIEVLLNLHSSHNVAFPFHFQHVSNANWNPLTNNSGMLPVVHVLEGQWIAAFKGHSLFVTKGSTLWSSCGAPVRPFVECMMHDRWTADPAWPGAPVMAITFEGTYGRGPNGVTWNTPADYRATGADMGRALADHLGLQFSATIAPFGATCGGAVLSGSVVQGSAGLEAHLVLGGAPANALAWLAVGFTRTTIPLPWSAGCSLHTDVSFSLSVPVNGIGLAQKVVAIPPIPGLVANVQGVMLDFSGAAPVVSSSNALEVRNDF